MNSEINDKNSLIKQILSLDLLKAAALVKELESELGLPIGSSAAFSAPSAPGVVENSPKSDAVEKTEFKIVLKGFDSSKKIPVIKALRAIDSDLNLTQAKEKVEALPYTVASNKSKEEAEKIKKDFEDVGAEVELE